MVTLLGLIGCAGERPAGLGYNNDKLATCPDSPNCVSSFESRESHLIAPIKSSLAEIEKVLLGLPEANIIQTADNYLYVEFTSKIMGYVDDVEFLFDPDEGVVQVRSASRLGHSDLGVNRKRIESIRALVGS